MRRLCAILLVLLLVIGPALAVNPDEILDDPVLESRAREISSELRCLVCQNQSIDDSDADLARDLRIVVRERLTAGDSDAAVMDYVVARYGEFVLLRPVLGWHTILLWAAAPAVLLLGLVGVWRALKQPNGSDAEEALTADEQNALEALEASNGPDSAKPAP